MAVKQNNSEAGEASENAGGSGSGMPPNAKPSSSNGMKIIADENGATENMETGSPPASARVPVARASKTLICC